MSTQATIQTVPINDAKTWAKEWQRSNPNRARAFLIKIEDIIGTFLEMGVLTEDSNGNYTYDNNVDPTDVAIRAYMATNVKESEGFGNKLLIVGTRKLANGIYEDIIEDEGGAAVNLAGQIIGSGVFDFTEPCPNTCDPNTPLK